MYTTTGQYKFLGHLHRYHPPPPSVCSQAGKMPAPSAQSYDASGAFRDLPPWHRTFLLRQCDLLPDVSPLHIKIHFTQTC